MREFLDGLLNSICHRGGEFSSELPLCLRCSSVYAGALLGFAFEAVLRCGRKARPGRAAFALGAGGLALMAVAALNKLCRLYPEPVAFEVIAGLWFGASLAFLAVTAVFWRPDDPEAAGTVQAAGRGAFLGVLAVWAAMVARRTPWAVWMLGSLAVPGVVVTFLAVNAAFVLVFTRTASRGFCRALVSLPIAMLLGTLEFALFALWRRA